MCFELTKIVINCDNDITTIEKMVLCVLADMTKKDEFSCYPSHAHIAAKCRCSKKSVITALKALEDKSLIVKKTRLLNGGNTSNFYVILRENLEKTIINPSVTVTPPQCNHYTPLVNVLHPPSVTVTPEYINKQINKQIIEHTPLLSPKGETANTAEGKGRSIIDFFKNESRDDFKGQCVALCLSKEITTEQAEGIFIKFESYWIANSKNQKGRKSDWFGTFRNWLSKSNVKTEKTNVLSVGKEIHKNATEYFSKIDLIAEDDERINDFTPFVKLLKKGYSRQEISETLKSIVNNPPKQKIYSWAYLFTIMG